MTASIDKPRLVIYGTGQMGLTVVRLACERGWPIIAAYNRAGPKVGQDLGRLAGLQRDLGVTVQDCDTADYGGLDADIGVVTTTNLLRLNLPAYRRLIGAGLNILCHGTESYFPKGNDPALAAQIDELARSRNVSFTGGGIWDMSRIWAGLLVAGPCTDLKALFHSSITDAEGQSQSAAMIQDHVGVGLTVEQFMHKKLDKSPIASSYKTIPEQVLTALGYTIGATRVHVEPVVFDVPVSSRLLGCTVQAGASVGSRIVGEIETAEGVTARAQIEIRLFKPGEVEHMFWSVDGLPRTRVRTERSDSGHATAACLFNRIQDVIAARPGIVPVSALGPLKHTALRSARS